MSAHGHLTSAQIRSRLTHPVIDADGHWIEFAPVFAEQIRKVGGDRAAEGFLSVGQGTRDALAMSVAERQQRRISQEAFWARPEKNTRDRATAMLPRLLYERLAEFGIDFAVIYPTAGLRLPRIADDERRRAACRAFNIVTADYFQGFADRLTPAAVIPMHTPEEAIAELEHSTRQLGCKVAMFGSLMPRPVPAIGEAEGDAQRFAVWYDALGLDGAHDYDPVWAKCLELGIAPTFHSGARRQGLRLSPTNFTYNHIGHFAAAGHAVCKAMFPAA
jgi:predicted TIM-barrel fold metal-dependent hydrolase